MTRKAYIFGANTLNLKYCENDVGLLSTVLSLFNYETTISKPILGVIEKGEIIKSLDNFFDSCSPNDTIVIYFSGHAYSPKGQLLLLLDNDLKNTNKSSIPLNYILSQMEECRAKNKLLILDCCHALGELDMWRPKQSESVKILAASGRFEQAKEIDEFKSSFLSYIIYNALNNDFYNICDNRENISVNSLYEWILNQTVIYNDKNKTKMPSPKLIGDQGNDFILCSYDSNGLPFPIKKYLNRITLCFSSCKRDCFGRNPWCRPVFETLISQKHYVIPRIRCSHNNISFVIEKLNSYFESWVSKNDLNHIILLGDAGVGKSSACIYLLNELSQNCLKRNTSGIIPIYLSLDMLNRKGFLGSDIHRIFQEYLDIKITEEELLSLIRSKRILFILDGFDEISNRANHSKILQNLDGLHPIFISECKTIMTCRTHYFANQDQIDEIILGKISFGTDLLALLYKDHPYFSIIELQDFSTEEIKELISNRYPDKKDIIWTNIQNFYNLRELSRSPILLNLILKTLPELLHKKSEIVRVDLYNAYSNFWLRREAERKRNDIDLKKKEEFIEKLAVCMWENDTTSLHFEELENEIKTQYCDLLLSETDFYSKDYDVRNCSFLNRDEDGYYRFMHKSFMEFFVAKKCILEIRQNGKGMNAWKIRWFDKEVANFLAELIQTKIYINKLKSLAILSSNSENKIILWNTLHILSLICKNYFDSFIGEKILEQIVERAENEKGAVILRQYCRIIAKFYSPQKAEEFIKKIIEIVMNSSYENDDNNQTYINYYYGRRSACEALISHLSTDIPKYDRLLHIYVLGEIGELDHAKKLKELAENWKIIEHIELANKAIFKITKNNPSGAGR